MKNLELLAPAGSSESLIAALNNGANAVYLGMQGFNARSKAENFNEQNIRQYVKLCHLFNVKVYLTVNTLVKDSEFGNLINLIKTAVEAKVDTFIIQDLGVANVLKKAFPNIVMHASTQMGIHNLEGAKIAKQLGFSRIVLSREATLEDIKKIKNNCDIEIEYFVQGALCVAFSGNCYYSSLCFGESGNRGKCLQPCRLCYTASVNENKLNSGYLISPNDLCLITRLNELISAGVTSFKIEGRMRRPAYVSQAVQSYRRALDNLKLDVNNEIEKLQKVFSRGVFNSGYYLDNSTPKKLINTQFQNHRGVKIGTVIAVSKFKELNKITIKTNNYKISAGDGLKFISDGFESSMGVGNANQIKSNQFEVFSKNNAKVGCEVYLTLDSETEQKLLSTTKKLRVNATFDAKVNKKAELTLEYKGIKATVLSEEIISEAKSAPATFNQIEDSVNRMVETSFELNNLTCNLENVFIPKSVINNLRRIAVEQLENNIISCYEQKMPKVVFDSNFSLKPQLQFDFKNQTYYIVDEKQTYSVPNNCNIVLAPSVFNEFEINKLKQNYNDCNIFVMLPLIARGDDINIINKVISGLNKQTEGLVINNVYGLYYALQGFKVVANYALNVVNSFALELLNNLKVLDVTKSIERDLSSGLNKGLSFRGYPSLMTYTHCPYKTSYGYNDCKNCKFEKGLQYTNERGHSFNIRRTKIANCYFELINDISLDCDNPKMIDLRGNN